MRHPYRDPWPPEPERRPPPPDDGCVDEDLTVVLLATLVCSLGHVVWCVDRAGELDRDFAPALGVAIVCLTLLRPFFRWALRRGLRRLARRP